jgi:hypothetical protein
MLRYKSKWLAILILVVAAALFIGGCPATVQPSTYLPPPSQTVNQPPVIKSLTCQWRQVKTSMDVPIECTASDPEGDELSYSWSVDGGTITGEGAVAEWLTPEKKYGTYTITVTVSDANGGQDTASLEIKVACCLKEVGE